MRRKGTSFPKKWKFPLWLSLVSLSFCFSFWVYTSGTKIHLNEMPVPEMNVSAQSGQELWQKHNCTACHQLFGLGGYLGPDLTAFFADSSKGAPYLKVILKTGIGIMPPLGLSEVESESIASFLKYVNECRNPQSPLSPSP